MVARAPSSASNGIVSGDSSFKTWSNGPQVSAMTPRSNRRRDTSAAANIGDVIGPSPCDLAQALFEKA